MCIYGYVELLPPGVCVIYGCIGNEHELYDLLSLLRDEPITVGGLHRDGLHLHLMLHFYTWECLIRTPGSKRRERSDPDFRTARGLVCESRTACTVC